MPGPPVALACLDWHVSEYAVFDPVRPLSLQQFLGSLPQYDSSIGGPRSVIRAQVKCAVANKNWTAEGLLEALEGAAIPDFAADYHVNIQPSDIVEVVRGSWKLITRSVMLDNLLSMGKVSALTVMLWMCTVNEAYVRLFLLAGLGFATNHKEFIARGKHLNNVCKHVQNVLPYDFKPLFEVHNLVNRVDTVIDWEAEKNNRVRPSTARVQPELVRRICRDMFKVVARDRGSYFQPQTWKDFWKRRFEWTPVGADYSPYEQDQAYREEKKEWRNKLSTVCNMPSNLKLDYFLQRTPACYAKTSIKYEWSKTRAIYGCDLTNFILHTFAMGKCEEALGRNFACGSQATEQIVAKKLDGLLDGRQPLCLDYEDFNAQHSTENMLAVLKAYGDVYKGRMSPEQVSAFEWCLEAIQNQHVLQGVGVEAPYKVGGTLFSGWKLTTFVNSCLNYCYYLVMFPTAGGDSHIHAGDDVISYVTDGSEYLQALRRAEKYNIRLSKQKCHLASVAEFLRVDHRSPECGQYLCRAITTMVMGRIETSPSFSMIEVAKSYIARCGSAIARGGDKETLTRVNYNALKRRFKLVDHALPLDVVLKTSVACGGLCNSVAASYEIDIAIQPDWFTDDDRPVNYFRKIPGLNDYAQVIKHTLKRFELRIPKLIDSLVNSYCKMFVKKPQKYDLTALEAESRRRRKIWQEYKGYFAKGPGFGQIGVARLAGCLPAVLADPKYAKIADFFTVPEERYRGLAVVL
nr:MAG: RNA-dependent RNA polymerase [Totiviridae sp.]